MDGIKFFSIAIDWNFYELHFSIGHNNHHILRWYEWGLLVFCKQTPFQLAAIGPLKLMFCLICQLQMLSIRT